jgi:hypothetical protein
VSSVELPVIGVAASVSHRVATPSPERHSQLVRRARMLAWLGIAWHVAEAAIAIAAGLAATSIALIGFGVDSLIESVAGLIVVWRFAEARRDSEAAERRAQRLIGASFVAIGVYIAVEAARSLLAGTQGQGPRRGRAAFLGHRQRGTAEPPLCLSLGGPAGRPWGQRLAWLVVGRPGHRACHRRGRAL